MPHISEWQVSAFRKGDAEGFNQKSDDGIVSISTQGKQRRKEGTRQDDRGRGKETESGWTRDERRRKS